MKSNFQNLDYMPLLALIIPLFAIMPLLTYTGLPNTADGPAHLMRQAELNQAWQQGSFYPRWGADLALGHGMPIFSYAPPFLYQLTQLFHLFGLPLDAAMKATLIFDLLLYSLGMFLFIRPIFGSYPALAASAVYIYAPYRLRELYIQGNYGQFSGLAFYPLIFWAFHRLITDGRPRYMAAAALSLAGLLFSHNISFMLFIPIFTAYLIFLLAQKIELTTIIRTTAAGLLGLGLAAIFWLPAFGERHDIKLEGITRGFFDFRENFISLPQLFALPLPLDLSAINPEFPLSLGLPQIIGAFAGIIALIILLVRLIAGISQQTIKNHTGLYHTIFFTFFLLLYVFMALPQSQIVWESVPFVELTEFPWRMLGPAIFCAGFLTAAAYAWLIPPGSYQITLPAVIIITIVLNGYYLYPSQFIHWGTPTPADVFAYELSSGAIGTTSTGEFLPKQAEQHPRPETLWSDYEAGRLPQKIDPASLPANATVKTVSHLAESDTIKINTPQQFTATIRTLYWPGWQTYLNEKPTPFSVTPKTGLIQTIIPTGQHTLTLRLESTPLRTTGKWLTILSIIVLVASQRVSESAKKRKNESLNRRFADSFLVGLMVAFYLLSRPLSPFFTMQSDPNRPEAADKILQADFGGQIRLVGMDEPSQTVQTNADGTAEINVTLYWRAIQKLDKNYSVFLHLDAPNGQTYGTVDEINPESIPTSNWPPGLYLRNPLRLKIPAGIPPIRYDLKSGIYDRTTGQRLSVVTSNYTDEESLFNLGTVWLTAPPPDLPAGFLARFGEDIIVKQAIFENNLLTIYWQTSQTLKPNQTIFIHLLDAKGDLIGQADGTPYDNLYPLENWLPQQIITDKRHFTPTTQINSLAIGIYNLTSGERLQVTNNSGTVLPNGIFTVPATQK